MPIAIYFAQPLQAHCPETHGQLDSFPPHVHVVLPPSAGFGMLLSSAFGQLPQTQCPGAHAQADSSPAQLQLVLPFPAFLTSDLAHPAQAHCPS